MNDLPLIIQFMHPGQEISPSRLEIDQIHPATPSGEPHHRKYLTHHGSWLDRPGSKSEQGSLFFWGEWEQPTRVTNIYRKETPSALHTPLLPNQRLGSVNTDPLVFGKNMFYTNCQQFRGGHATILNRLPEGSLILFGSHSKNRFLLDTVFVVRSKYSVSKPPSRKYYPTFHRAVYDLLKSTRSCSPSKARSGCTPPPCPTSIPSKGKGEYTFYQGATYDPSVPEKPFSFVPAKIDHNDRFNRIAITKLNGVVNANLKQGFKRTFSTHEQIRNVFSKVVDTVKKQGCKLAIHIDDV